MTTSLTSHQGMLTIASHDLADLLAQGRAAVAVADQRHATQRGATHALNRVALTWLAPQVWGSERLRWSPDEIAWYLRVFVAPIDGAAENTLLFPYTYRGRSRAWDGGWNELVALLDALPKLSVTVAAARQSFAGFNQLVGEVGEGLHVQTALSLCALYPPEMLLNFAAQPGLARQTAARWQQDLLGNAIADIGANAHSRRAVVGPLGYPHLEAQLQPQMGKPPYQLFQLLPDDATAPLCAIHEHRSLDVVGGAALDFAHDHLWLSEACATLGREMGDITLVAHNLHLYPDAPSDETIKEWLCRVTDGYAAGQGIPAQLLAQSAYAANAARIWEQWRAG